MPAVSQKQEKFFNFVHAVQKGEASAAGYPKVQEAAHEMKPSSVDHFRSGPHIDKSLPKEAGARMNKVLDHLETVRRNRYDRKMENWKWMGNKITQVGSAVTGAIEKGEANKRKKHDAWKALRGDSTFGVTHGDIRRHMAEEKAETPAQEAAEHRMKAAFEAGFVKRAAEYGMPVGQALDLLQSLDK